MVSAPTSHRHGVIETTDRFQPSYDKNGLIPAIVTDAKSGEVVMFAWMNDEALDRTIATGTAHYWSRSRQSLWQKGESSGNIQTVKEIRIDCDQDALWLRVETGGDGVNCHTGARSCFYRRVENSQGGDLRLIFDETRPR